MCGRFTLIASPEQLRQVFNGVQIPDAVAPRYNIAPSQPVAVIPNDGRNVLDFFSWGLIPGWAKDPSIGNRMINARAETLTEKPSFRTAFRRRRCLIPASGFFEWRQEAGRKVKTPMYIHLKSGKPFAFAGLWESWNAPDGSNILSCAIITTAPNDLMQTIHNRMPVILPEAAYDFWLTPGEQPIERLQALLQPYPADEMKAYPVSTLVNSPANDAAACIQPV
ncbi:MAG: SOS response-associated peptidase [Anaerolineales bacterium]|nr:SOS response-associated peptidase [Anaerolineales bacterium]